MFVSILIVTDPDPPSLSATHGGFGIVLYPIALENSVTFRQTVPAKPPILIPIVALPEPPAGNLNGAAGPEMMNLTTVTLMLAERTRVR
jgi:hypothetical protein